MIYGMDYLGGARFKDVILQSHPPGFAAGFFSNTFGDSRDVVDALLHTGKCPLIRIQLLWHDDHHFTSADIQHSVSEAQKWNHLIDKYPHVQWYLSGACEHNLNDHDAAKMSSMVAQASPKAHYVNTPLPTGAVVPGVINEGHGGGHPRYSLNAFSSDGNSSEDADIETIKLSYASAKYFMFWTSAFNGKYEDNDSTPRPQRTYTPSANLIHSVAFLGNSRGVVHMPANWLLKTHAEKKQNPDPRADHPLFIAPLHTDQIVVKDSHGKDIAGFHYYGNYIDGRSRYYCNDQWGYQIAKKAHQNTGSYLTDVFAQGQKIGTVNCGFRQGGFH